MDTLDLRILRALLQIEPTSSLDLGFRRSFSQIARDLRVDETTVSNRVRGLYRSGFLKGWSVAINPGLVGQEMVQLWVDVDASHAKPEVIAKIRLLPGVAVVKDLYGPSLGLVVYHDGPPALRRLVQLLARIAGPGVVATMPEPFSPCDLTITEGDLGLLRALQREPLTSYNGLARRLGVTAKTVQRRIRRLSEGGAIYLVAELDPKFLVGGIVGSLLVTYDDAVDREAIGARLRADVGEELMFASFDSPGHAYVALVLPGVARSRDLLARVRAIPGVTNARLDLVAEVVSQYEVYEEQLDRLERSPQFRPSQRRGAATPVR